MNREKMHFLTNSHLHRNSAALLCLLPIQIRQPGFPITDSEVWRLHCLAEGYLEEQNLRIKRELCQALSVASPNFQILPVAFQVPKKISHENHQYLLPGYPQLGWCFCQLLLLQRMQCHWKTSAHYAVSQLMSLLGKTGNHQEQTMGCWFKHKALFSNSLNSLCMNGCAFSAVQRSR